MNEDPGLSYRLEGGLEVRAMEAMYGLWVSVQKNLNSKKTGWWFQIFLFSPLFGEDSQFD